MSELKKYRQDKSLSQSQLANLSGVSVRMIQHYEQGQKDINKANGETLYRLAYALGVPIEAIIDTDRIIIGG